MTQELESSEVKEKEAGPKKEGKRVDVFLTTEEKRRTGETRKIMVEEGEQEGKGAARMFKIFGKKIRRDEQQEIDGKGGNRQEVKIPIEGYILKNGQFRSIPEAKVLGRGSFGQNL